YEVQVSLGDLQTSLSNAARSRTVYLNSGDETTLSEYPGTKKHVHNDLTQLRELVRDNGSQISLASQLDDIVLRRLELMDAAIEMRRAGPLDDATQLRLSRENV